MSDANKEVIRRLYGEVMGKGNMVVDGGIREHYGNVSMFEIHKMIGSHDLHDKLS